MAVTPQHGLLGRLLDYVVEQSKEIDPGAYTLTGASDFRRYPKDFAALPGVDLDLKLEGDHIWLQVQRLETRPAPRPSDALLRSFISVSDDPNGAPPQANEVALKYELSTEAKAIGLERAAQADNVRRAKVEEALRQLHPLWLAWAEGEKPRRRSIELYGDLFMLKGRLEAEETAKPSELVWGVGVSAWKLNRQLTENEAGKPATVDYHYPLLTQAVEIELDPQTHCIAVRPRAVPPRLEFDAFGACQVMGAAEVEKQAKLLLTKETEYPVTPFDISSFEPILKLVAGSLCRTGRYEPEVQSIPSPGPDLLVTAGWVLLVRERSSNFLVEDIRRLKTRLLAGDPIPEGPIALVTPPSDEVIRYEAISFRGMCGGSRKKGEPRELYFPLPYNQEQETIVEMLERAPGVAVQGPPGTGKTHTIANIICHYLATGRKVLVTSKGEHALEVLQSKIPEEVRPLSVALLSGDKEGMRQFQASIEAIIHNLSQLNPRITEEEIERCRQQIDAAHNELSGIDRRVNEIAEQQLANVEVDGVAMRAQKMAELVISGQELYGWFDDALTLDAEHAPPLTAVNAQALRDARRRLGSDLRYVAARLPSSQTLLPTDAVERLHNALVAMREIDAAQGCGDLWPLRAITPEVLEDARRLLASVEAVTAIVRELEELNSSWVFELRSRCRRPEYASECDALRALFGEIEELVKARAAFLQRPVQLPAEALDNSKVREAVEKAKDTGKPFSLFAFGVGDIKPLVAAVRISGQPPASQDDWLHVHRYLGLHARVLSFGVRWNQFAELLSMPTVQGTVEALRSIEMVALAAMKSYTLATVHDVQLPLMAGRVFPEPPTGELQGTSAELSVVRKHLRQHLTRAELAAAATQLAILQEKLAGTSGPVAEQLHTFIATELGSPEVKAERAVARYAELVGELKRIESLASHIATVNELCRQVEFAGGQKLAARLRTQALAASGEDNVLPVAWREAWNWARLKSHLDTIDAREELLALSSRRRDLERLLAQQYERLVARSAWLGAKSQASAKVLSALESYRTAIRKIGQGTGPNATRYRRDAQKAMQDAQGAIPCWIMSHSKVSESMPGQLGAFDLVIVDEASQSNLWALPAILRGKKILVVGDDKQVSPEGGFISAAKILSLRERFLGDQAYAADLTPEKSLYDIASTVFAAQKVMLAEHFRCVHPIIAYSNRTFYKDQIKPLRVPKTSERIDPPLIDVYVTTGERSKKDANRQEAEFIAAEIESILRNPKLRHRTLGVVSLLGLDQAQAIDTLVRSRCDAADATRPNCCTAGLNVATHVSSKAANETSCSFRWLQTAAVTMRCLATCSSSASMSLRAVQETGCTW